MPSPPVSRHAWSDPGYEQAALEAWLKALEADIAAGLHPFDDDIGEEYDDEPRRVGTAPEGVGPGSGGPLDPGRAWRSTPITADGAYARIAELERLTAGIELERADLVAALIETRTQADINRRYPPEGPAPSAAAVRDLRDGARVAVIDSLMVVTGTPRTPWLKRAEYCSAPEATANAVRSAVDAGVVTFEQGSALLREGRELDLTPQQLGDVTDSVLTHAQRSAQRCGRPIGQRVFRERLNRAVQMNSDPQHRREAIRRRRGVRVFPEGEGAAVFRVVGDEARCVAALARVDAVARSVKRGGDERTLEQLRADAALDLLTFGVPHPGAPTSIDTPCSGGWPPAVVNIVVSAASLLGANDEPGLVEDTPVPAHVIREMAYAQGSVWQRIVADPVTGYAMSTTVDAYRPTAEMARVVRARDGRCRGPGCTRPATPGATQIDHVTERHRGGRTSPDDLQCLCQVDHTKKTNRHWFASMTGDGVVTWRLPDGRETKTYPMDYRDFGIDTLASPPARGPDGEGPPPFESTVVPGTASTIGAATPSTRGPSNGEQALIDERAPTDEQGLTDASILTEDAGTLDDSAPDPAADVPMTPWAPVIADYDPDPLGAWIAGERHDLLAAITTLMRRVDDDRRLIEDLRRGVPDPGTEPDTGIEYEEPPF